MNVYREDKCVKSLLNVFFCLRWGNSMFGYNKKNLVPVSVGNTLFYFCAMWPIDLIWPHIFRPLSTTRNNIQICNNDFQFPSNPLVLKRFPLYITTSPSHTPTKYPLMINQLKPLLIGTKHVTNVHIQLNKK